MTVQFSAILAEIRDAELYEKPGGYKFKRYSFGEESKRYNTSVVSEVINWSRQQNSISSCDVIGGIEPGGLPWAMAIGSVFNKPVVPVRSESMILRNLEQSTVIVENEYSRKKLFLRGTSNGEALVLIDDVISSGETLVRAADLLTSSGFRVVGVSVILIRNSNILLELEQKIGCSIEFMIDEGDIN